MHILKIIVSGFPLFTTDVEFDFLPLQRVSKEARESLHHLFSNYYQNNVLTVIGINASGKTTLLKVIAFALRLLNNESLNAIDSREIFDGLGDEQRVSFDLYFSVSGKTLYRLHAVIQKQLGRLVFCEEELLCKPVSTVKRKSDLWDFTKREALFIRDQEEEFLPDDVSIMIALNKSMSQRLVVTDMLRFTNNNLLPLSGDIPPELIAFFDPSIEYLHYDRAGIAAPISLKFRGKEELLLSKASELNRYLSSGTIKGINIFMQSMKLLRTGGYMVIDEMENHFNKEIILTLIRFYMDKKINTGGAVLIFSTHWAELLDEFSANDSIYVVHNERGIAVDNLSTLLTRNDVKKSDAYQSGMFGLTTPLYESYMRLKEILLRPAGEA